MGIFDIFGGEKKPPTTENKAGEVVKNQAPKTAFKERNWDNPSEEALELERLHDQLK